MHDMALYAQTMLPMISSLAPPAGYAVWSTVFAFLCKRLSRMFAKGSLRGQRVGRSGDADKTESIALMAVSVLEEQITARREEGQRQRRCRRVELQTGQHEVGHDAGVDCDLDLLQSAGIVGRRTSLDAVIFGLFARLRLVVRNRLQQRFLADETS